MFFTLVARHPECQTVILNQVKAKDLTSIVLGLNPVKSVEIYLAQASHTRQTAQQIQDTASAAVLCYSRPGGFDVEYVGPGQTPHWARRPIRELDWSQLQERRKRRELSLAVDKARERTRGLPQHKPHDPMYTLEQRAKLVSA